VAGQFSSSRDERRGDSALAAGRSGGLILWLSGADPHVLAKVPRERRKFSGIGGVVLTTAVMATLSATFALSSGVRVPLLLAIPLGVLWGLAIMNLDRWLVTAAVRRERWYQNLAVALPRLILALIIGAVISTPLVLWIFQREINTELDIIHQQKLDQQAQILNNDTRFKGMPALQDRVNKLQGIVDGTAAPESVEDDPTVKNLETQVATASNQYNAAQQAANKELDGTDGTHSQGAGPVYQQKQKVADDLKRQRDDLQNQLDAAKRAAQARINGSAANEKQSATDELAKDKAELARLTTLKKQESDQFAANNREDRGLLAQMDALTHFTNHSFTLKTAYIALLLFITAIEVLPVFTKFLLNLGPPTLYDQILAKAEETDVETATASFDYEKNLAARELETRSDHEHEVVDGLVKKMVAVEAEVYDKAIDRWRTEQLGLARSGNGTGPEQPRTGLTGLLGSLGLGRSATPRQRRRSADGYAEWPDAERDGGRPDTYGSDNDDDGKWGWG